MTTLSRAVTARVPLLAAAAAAALIGLAPGRLYADPAAKVSFLFSDQPKDHPLVPLLLRPTVQQQLFVFVHNDEKDDLKDVTVEVLADGATVAKTAKPITVKPNGSALADFSKPAEPAAVPAAPPAPPAPPAAKPAAPAPALAEVKGPVVLQVFDKDHNPIGEAQPLEVRSPSEYIDFVSEGSRFTPGPVGGKNRLTVRLKTEAHFFGPPCRVELALSPQRIPGLQELPRKEGTRAGFLSPAATQDGNPVPSTMTLTAENLTFDWPKDGKDVSGLVYLTIDGWERAYTLQTTFSATGDATTPVSIDKPMIRLAAPNFANPGAPYPVKIEADRIGDNFVELGLDRTGGDRPEKERFRPENNEITMFPTDARLHPRDRRVHLLFGAAGDGGSLLLQPQVEDWKTDLDVTGIDGNRDLRVRLLDDKKNEVEFWGARPLQFGEEAPKTANPLGQHDLKALSFTVIFDESQPQDVTLILPKKIKRGAVLPVAATIDRPEEIGAVLFYVGKPGPDGKPPANVETVTGDKQDVKNDKGDTVVGWAADLPAPTDAKGTVPVTVQFVKINNLTRTGTVTVTLEEAGPAGPAGAPAAKPLNVSGVVFEAGQAVIDKDGKTTLTPDARPQQGIEVHLVDDKGALKDAAKTNAEGKFVFNGVAPGAYKVTAAKTTDSTAGQSAVQVVDKDKTDVDIKLTR